MLEILFYLVQVVFPNDMDVTEKPQVKEISGLPYMEQQKEKLREFVLLQVDHQ